MKGNNPKFDMEPYGTKVKPHWTQTPEGKLKLAKAMRRAHKLKAKTGKKWKSKRGLTASKKGITHPTVDVRSALVYLHKAQSGSPRWSRAMVELAILTLMGEDR